MLQWVILMNTWETTTSSYSIYIPSPQPFWYYFKFPSALTGEVALSEKRSSWVSYCSVELFCLDLTEDQNGICFSQVENMAMSKE